MKIRHGFVSNSSSTSFTIYGVIITDADEDKIDGYDKIFHGDPNSYDSHTYLGVELTSMNMDETKKEFFDRVSKELSEELGRDVTNECQIYSESYYDG